MTGPEPLSGRVEYQRLLASPAPATGPAIDPGAIAALATERLSDLARTDPWVHACLQHMRSGSDPVAALIQCVAGLSGAAERALDVARRTLETVPTDATVEAERDALRVVLRGLLASEAIDRCHHWDEGWQRCQRPSTRLTPILARLCDEHAGVRGYDVPGAPAIRAALAALAGETEEQ